MSAFKDNDKAKQQHINVQRQIEKLPKDQQKMIEETSRIVETTMLEFEAGIDSGESFALHEQMKKFFATHRLKDSDHYREVLQDIVSVTKPGDFFKFQGISFIKTFDNKIFLVKDYIYTLEKSIMTKESLDGLCTYLSFFDIVKLTFKKLFGGLNG